MEVLRSEQCHVKFVRRVAGIIYNYIFSDGK